MKIALNKKRRISALGLPALIIFIVALIVIVGTVVYLIYKIAKLVNPPPPPPPPIDSPAMIGYYDNFVDVAQVTNTVTITNNLKAVNNTVRSPQPTIKLDRYTTEGGNTVNVLSLGEYEATGPFTIVFERTPNLVDWEPFKTNVITLNDLAMIDFNGEMFITNTVALDTNNLDSVFYRVFIKP